MWLPVLFVVAFFVGSAILCFCGLFFHDVPISIILFFAGAEFLFISWCCLGNLFLNYRQYFFSKEGVLFKFGNTSAQFFAWSKISQIGICKVHYTSRTPYRYRTVIRFVLGEEHSGPANGYGFWSNAFYEIINYKRIAIIDYSDSLLDELRQLAPATPIVDYRHIRKNEYDT